jgi:hypothetical protein
MLPSQKQAWIDALRSGRFEQGRDNLCNIETNEYCCLGVYAEINNLFSSTSRNGLKIAKDCFLGDIYVPDSEIDRKTQIILAGLNDDGKSFEVIATYIEENL